MDHLPTYESEWYRPLNGGVNRMNLYRNDVLFSKGGID